MLPGFVTHVLDEPFLVDLFTCLNQVSFRIFHHDSTFAPPGKTAVTCFLPAYNCAYWVDLQKNDQAEYQKAKKQIAEAVAGILERVAPGARHAIEAIDVSTPATVIRYTGNWRGSMEGWLPTPAVGFRMMPNSISGLQRFVMAGHWVQPGGGLPAAC